jgi:uncharacterized membrane protein
LHVINQLPVDLRLQPRWATRSSGRSAKAFPLGPERTPEEDEEFGIVEISDITSKALSPGTNDPTAAHRC